MTTTREPIHWMRMDRCGYMGQDQWFTLLWRLQIVALQIPRMIIGNERYFKWMAMLCQIRC